jgi:hypothetical protein
MFMIEMALNYDFMVLVQLVLIKIIINIKYINDEIISVAFVDIET